MVRHHCLMCGVNVKPMSPSETSTGRSDEVCTLSGASSLPPSSIFKFNTRLPSFWTAGMILQTLPSPMSCRLSTPSETSTTPKATPFGFWWVAVGDCFEQPPSSEISKVAITSEVRCFINVFIALCWTDLRARMLRSPCRREDRTGKIHFHNMIISDRTCSPSTAVRPAHQKTSSDLCS